MNRLTIGAPSERVIGSSPLDLGEELKQLLRPLLKRAGRLRSRNPVLDEYDINLMEEIDEGDPDTDFGLDLEDTDDFMMEELRTTQQAVEHTLPLSVDSALLTEQVSAVDTGSRGSRLGNDARRLRQLASDETPKDSMEGRKYLSRVEVDLLKAVRFNALPNHNYKVCTRSPSGQFSIRFSKEPEVEVHDFIEKLDEHKSENVEYAKTFSKKLRDAELGEIPEDISLITAAWKTVTGLEEQVQRLLLLRLFAPQAGAQSLFPRQLTPRVVNLRFSSSNNFRALKFRKDELLISRSWNPSLQEVELALKSLGPSYNNTMRSKELGEFIRHDPSQAKLVIAVCALWLHPLYRDGFSVSGVESDYLIDRLVPHGCQMNIAVCDPIRSSSPSTTATTLPVLIASDKIVGSLTKGLALPTPISVHETVRSVLESQLFEVARNLAINLAKYAAPECFDRVLSFSLTPLATVKLYNTVALLKDELRKETYLIPRTFLVMYRDQLLRKCLAMIALAADRQEPFRCELLRRFYEFIESRRQTLADKDFYKLVGSIEAWTVGLVLSRDPAFSELVPVHEYFLATEQELRPLLGRPRDCPIYTYSHDPDMLIEIYGVAKHFGHPVVNVEEGLVALRELATAVKDPIPQQLSAGVRSMFKKSLIKEYREKHGRYPDFDYSQLSDTTQRKIANNDEFEKIDAFASLVSIDKIQCKKIFNLSESLNLAQVLTDKSVCDYRPDSARSLIDTGRPSAGDKRKIITRYLSRPEDLTVEGLVDIIRGGAENIDEKHRVIQLKAKEKELKPKGRFFALLTLEMRMLAVVTEKLIADSVLQYFKQITMKSSSTKLQDEKLRLVAHQSHVTKAFISLDFEKWNSNFRAESTDPVFKCLDDLFGGSPLFTIWHRFFASCDIFSGDVVGKVGATKEGPWKPTNFNWTGHAGGNEGLKQKAWTLVTVSAINYFTRDLGIKFDLLAQGDNQMLTLYFDSKETKASIIQKSSEFYNKLDAGFRLLGLPLKRQESWFSLILLIYGKDVYLNGRRLSLLCKRAGNMSIFSTTEIYSLSSMIGQLSAGLTDTGNESRRLITPVLLSQVWLDIVEDILRETGVPGSSPFEQQNKPTGYYTVLAASRTYASASQEDLVHLPKAVRFFSTYGGPSMFGFPSLDYFSLISNGFPDTSMKELSWANASLPRQQYRSLTRVLETYICNPGPKSILIKDVYSINCCTPVSLNWVGKLMIAGYFNQEGRPVNPSLAPLFSTDVRSADQFSRVVLDELTTLHPKIANLIRSMTVPGSVERVIGVFMYNKSTFDLSNRALLAKGHSVYHLSRMLDTAVSVYLVSVYLTIIGDKLKSPWYSPADAVRRLRTKVWGDSLEPLALFDWFTEFEADEGEREEYECLYNPDGGFGVYTGKSTKEKTMKSYELADADASTIVRRITDGARMIGWVTDYGTKLASLIRSLISLVTDLHPSRFENLATLVEGNVDHRLKGPWSTTSRASGLITEHSKVFTVTGSCRFLRGAEANFNVFVQGLITGTNRIALEMCQGKKEPRVIKFKIGTSSLRNLEDTKYDLKNRVDTEIVRSPTDSELFYARFSGEDAIDLSFVVYFETEVLWSTCSIKMVSFCCGFYLYFNQNEPIGAVHLKGLDVLEVLHGVYSASMASRFRDPSEESVMKVLLEQAESLVLKLADSLLYPDTYVSVMRLLDFAPMMRSFPSKNAERGFALVTAFVLSKRWDDRVKRPVYAVGRGTKSHQYVKALILQNSQRGASPLEFMERREAVEDMLKRYRLDARFDQEPAKVSVRFLSGTCDFLLRHCKLQDQEFPLFGTSRLLTKTATVYESTIPSFSFESAIRKYQVQTSYLPTRSKYKWNSVVQLLTPDDSVLVLGDGSGGVSILCAEFGAKRVFWSSKAEVSKETLVYENWVPLHLKHYPNIHFDAMPDVMAGLVTASRKEHWKKFVEEKGIKWVFCDIEVYDRAQFNSAVKVVLELGVSAVVKDFAYQLNPDLADLGYAINYGDMSPGQQFFIFSNDGKEEVTFTPTGVSYFIDLSRANRLLSQRSIIEELLVLRLRYWKTLEARATRGEARSSRGFRLAMSVAVSSCLLSKKRAAIVHRSNGRQHVKLLDHDPWKWIEAKVRFNAKRPRLVMLTDEMSATIDHSTLHRYEGARAWFGLTFNEVAGVSNSEYINPDQVALSRYKLLKDLLSVSSSRIGPYMFCYDSAQATPKMFRTAEKLSF